LNFQPNDFAIYLLRNDTLQTWQAKQLPLNALDLAPRPLVGIHDIESYKWSDHEMSLTAEGVAKFKVLEKKTHSSSGFPFVVMVGNRRIYMGNIFRRYSSYMPGDLPFLFVPLEQILKIGRAPDRSIKDQREDPRIYHAFARRNKLT
jgi:hypothetical protein